MIISTIYFLSPFISWKAQLDTTLSKHGKALQWHPIKHITEAPAMSLTLLDEESLTQTDWPLLPARKTIILTKNWSLEKSLLWIERGATNCFAYDDKHLIAWLVSELSAFPIQPNNATHDDVLQVIIDAIPAPIFFKDKLHVYRGCNTAFCEGLGLSRNKIIGHSVYDVAPAHLADKYYAADCELLAKGGKQRYEAEVCFADGKLHEIEFNKAIFTSSNGEPLGQVGVMLDVTERNQLMRELDKTTRIDPLTGTSNRREFDQILAHELYQQKTGEIKLSLMTLDVDFFKKINDKFGHSGGDQALQLIAQWLQSQIRETDHLFRIGGEEFYILMRNTHIDNAFTIAQRLCKDMATHTFLINQQSLHITLSAGVIELTPDTDLEEALIMVDKALYEAKSDGRNCVCPVYQ